MNKTFRNFGSVLALVWAASTIYSANAIGQAAITEAPAGFDNLTNGFVDQATFDAARATFEEREEIDEGLGPLYNADSCAACHANSVTGAISQITELRAGHFDGLNFFDQVGGSLINDRAIDASIQERVLGTSEVRAFRTSLSVLGDGFIEAIDSNTLVAIANSQPAALRGTFIQVPVLEKPGAVRGGRFGWKNQHASLMSFAADAYLNEMGITSDLLPEENTSNGNSVADFDDAPDPEDAGNADVKAFAIFMRATKAPPRDAVAAGTADAMAGSDLFDSIGCGSCHVRTITTAPPGTAINGGALAVHPALGNKRIHPFSDFLMHDVGTGDGIVQNGGQATRNQLRTPPLWGLRSKGRLMHDGESLTRNDAILRHAGQATGVINNYRALSTTNKNRLIAFLNSL
ncbi:MAG TPA: di-heme oxidoredictase family protein [Vicinamibacterales bacterium]|nr:di-heme oxidoredictase family protein [Vicinamibacterales bacterium]